jgi:hypothetical protein
MKNNLNRTLLVFFCVATIYFVVSPSLINYAEPTSSETFLIALMRFPLFSLGLPENSILFFLLLLLNMLFWGFLINFMLSFFFKFKIKTTQNTEGV